MIEVVEAKTAEELEAVYTLTYQAYVNRGYIEPNDEHRLVHYPQLEGIPQTKALVAKQDGVIVGTNSLTLDGPAGLHCEHDYPMQVMRERLNTDRLACSWRIISINEDWRVLRKLVLETMYRFISLNVRTFLMTFQPKHALRYVQMLDADIIGYSDTTSGLSNAPSLLVKADTLKAAIKLGINL